MSRYRAKASDQYRVRFTELVIGLFITYLKRPTEHGPITNHGKVVSLSSPMTRPHIFLKVFLCFSLTRKIWNLTLIRGEQWLPPDRRGWIRQLSNEFREGWTRDSSTCPTRTMEKRRECRFSFASMGSIWMSKKNFSIFNFFLFIKF